MRRTFSTWIPLIALACGSANDDGLFSGAPQDAGSSGAAGGAGGAGATGGESASTAGTGGATFGDTGGVAGAGPMPSAQAGASAAGAGGVGGAGGGRGVGAAAGAPQAGCVAGSLSASWTGTYVLSGLPSTTSGTLELTIDAAGAVTGTWVGVSPTTSSADIEGTVDCATGAITANILNGNYSALFPPISGTFTGELTGSLDTATSSVADGAWTVTEPNGNNGGSGTWATG